MNHYTTGKQFWSSIAAWLFIVLTLVIKPSSAQVFPVQANITVTPPYTVYLSHYTTPDQQRVMVNVLLRDPVVNNLDVYLRFSVEGGGVKLYTNPGWKPAPLTLQSGIPLLIPASTIAEYFRPQNVIVEGMSQQELYRGGKLPEGYYQFKVEVLEYKRGVPISNVGRTGIWLLLNEPPRLVFPTANQKVKATNPQFVNFSWVPGSIASPLSAQNTMYEFTLVELQGDIDPNVAIATAPDAIRFTRATQQTSLLYGPGEPPLLPGKRYAFRVRAYNTEGYEIFKNNGYSDVRVFQFGDACLPPTLFTLKDETQNSFNIEVVMDPGCTGWQAQLRESGSETTEWSILKAETITSKTVKGLKASTTYQVQLKSLCGTVSSDFTAPQTITTKQKVNTQRSCDNSVSPFVVQQASPLKALKPKDIFLAALVSIKVTEVTSQGGGKFTGKGVASLPLFNAGLAVTFTDVSINEHMQLTAGEVVVERSNVNITLFGDNQNLPGGGAGGGTNSDSTGTSQWPEFTDTLNLNSDIDTVVMVNDSTVWVYTTGSSEPVVVNMGGNDCLLIVPANGNMDKAVVVYNGAAQPYRVGSGNNDSSSQHFAALRAWFTPTTGTQFGYDSLLIKEYSTFYNDLSVDSTMFKLPWKALAAGYTEPVAMHVRQGSDSLSYSTIKVVADGRPLAPSAGANTALQTYNLTGTRSGDEYPVLAIYSKDNKDAYVGGLWTATYQRKDFTLYLVPLPGTQVTEGTIGLLHNYLNQIYSQAVVSWNVQLITGFPGVDLGSNGLDHADNELLSAYNSEMNGVIEAFKTWKGKLNSDAAYLFLVPKADGGLQGYMPFNRSFGFVVAPADANGNVDAATLARTAAHELGHGIFSLRHTFSTKNVVTLAQGTTDNLMDYSGTTATRLNKYQWDLIHDPNGVLFAWAEEEEEGAGYSYKHKSGREYGWLSAEQESGKDAGCALGYDDKGGCSYGKHQLAVRTGTLKDFLNWVNTKTSNQYSFFTEEMINESKASLSESQCLECDFTKKWMELCNNEEFNSWQKNYILETHYKPLKNRIITNFGETKLFSSMSAADEEALIEMCISLGVQHGGAYRIFQMALLKDYRGCSDEEILEETEGECSPQKEDFPPMSNKNKEQIEAMSKNADQLTMREFVERVYAARKLYVKANNVSGWKSMVLNRYKQEPDKLINTLNLK